MSRGLNPAGVRSVLLIIAALFVLGTSAGALCFVYPAPFADMVDTEATLTHWQSAGAPLSVLLNWRINEHVSPVGALLFAVHRTAFASDETFLVVVNLTAWAGVAGLVGLSARRAGAPLWAALVLAGFLFWPGVVGTNPAWGQQAPIFLGVLLAVAALWLAVFAETIVGALAAMTLATMAVFTFGWGVAAPAMVALAFASRRRSAWLIGAAAVLVAVSAGAFLVLSPRAGAHLAVGDIGAVIAITFALLGAIIERATAGSEVLGLVFGAGAGLLGAWTSARALLRNENKTQAFFAVLLLWALAGAALTGLARADLGVSQGFASRYAILSGLFWAALICLNAPAWSGLARPIQIAGAVAGCVFLLGAVAVTPKEWMRFQRDHNDVAAAAIATMMGAPGALQPLAYPRPGRALRTYKDLHQRGLSLFRHPLGQSLGARAPAPAQICPQTGSLSVQRVGPRLFRLDGEMVGAPLALRRLVLAVDRRGIVVGLSAVGGGAHNPARIDRPAVRGLVRGGAPAELHYVAVADGRACLWRPNLS